MKPVPPERMPGEEALNGLAAYESALDELIANSSTTVRIFDRCLSRGFNTPRRHDLLRRLLLADRGHRIYILVHDSANVVRDCPRLVSLLRLYSHGIRVHQTLPAARRIYDPFAIGDDARFVRRFHYDDVRGISSIGDVAGTVQLLKRFEELWTASAQAVAPTTIGL